MGGFIFLWISLFYFGRAKKVCYFELRPGMASFECKSPSADDIIHAREQIENKNLSGITTLAMADCNITKLYSTTFDFHTFVEIKTLYLTQNSLTSLPKNLFYFTALTKLNQLRLDYNKLVSPKQFDYLQYLQSLDLSYNRFSTFESGLLTLNPIKILVLEGNNIEILPDEFLAGNISQTLRDLYLNKNSIREIPHCLLQRNKPETVFPELTVLDLGENRIKELPSGLFNSTNWSLLNSLDLHHNSISYLHLGIFHSIFLTKLTEINLSFNQLESLPTKFLCSPALSNLISLKLSHNKIKFLSYDLFHSPYLQNLEYIDLSYNKISSIPFRLFKNPALANLTYVY